jgi:hypothetical protein
MGKNFRKDVSDFFESFPKLAADFALPACVPDYVRGERYFGSSLRVSSKGTQLWTHYDVMDNLLCNVTGIKRVCLWPPDQVRRGKGVGAECWKSKTLVLFIHLGSFHYCSRLLPLVAHRLPTFTWTQSRRRLPLSMWRRPTWKCSPSLRMP